MKKYLIVVFTFISALMGCYSQSNYDAFRKKTNDKLELLSNFSMLYFENEENVFDPDSLSEEIVRDVVSYLKQEGLKGFNVPDFPLIERVESEDGKFEVLVIGYHCGGTAGWIPHSIVIKHDEENSFVYSIDGEMYLYDFSCLKDNTYLCFGTVPGSGIVCRGAIAVTINFGKDSYDFVPVFDRKAFFTMCNSELSYNDNEKFLTVEYEPYRVEDFSFDDFLKERGYEFLSIEPKSENTDGSYAVFKSRFDGEKFIKP